MPPEEVTGPSNAGQDPTTLIFVQLGVLQEGMRNALGGIDEIKTTLNSYGSRISDVERKQAILETRLDAVAVTQKDAEEDAKPEKGRMWQAMSAVVSLLVLAFFIFDRIYAASGH